MALSASYDYTSDLNKLKEAQKNAAIADLEKTRNQTLSDLTAENQKNTANFNSQRSSINAQNKLGAKNFQEYLASTGRANSGLSAQAKMQNSNNLNTSLNSIYGAENAARADINRRTTDANNAYNTGLASANANIESNYITNLMTERQRQFEREQTELANQLKQKELDESIRQFNENLALQKQQLANSYYRSSSSSSSNSSKSNKTYAVNTDWYQGPLNSDVKNGVFSTKDNNGIAYQPDNINGKKLKSSGKTVGQMFGNGSMVGSTGANLDNQNVWTVNGKYYVWDGSQNQYIRVK